MKTYPLHVTKEELKILEAEIYSLMEELIAINFPYNNRDEFNKIQRLHSRIEDCIVCNDLQEDTE